MAAEAASRLFLVRHGRVHNPGELAYGFLPRFRIDPEGEAQAERAAVWLAAQGIAAIYSSPLLRARQTARRIHAAAGGVPLHINTQLRESGLARHWQGLPWREIAVQFPELYAAFETSPSTITTGESLAAMAKRMLAACRRAARRYPGTTVALASHRDPILALRLHVEGASFDELNRTRCQPGSISEFEMNGNHLRFRGYVEP